MKIIAGSARNSFSQKPDKANYNNLSMQSVGIDSFSFSGDNKETVKKALKIYKEGKVQYNKFSVAPDILIEEHSLTPKINKLQSELDKLTLSPSQKIVEDFLVEIGQLTSKEKEKSQKTLNDLQSKIMELKIKRKNEVRAQLTENKNKADEIYSKTLKSVKKLIKDIAEDDFVEIAKKVDPKIEKKWQEHFESNRSVMTKYLAKEGAYKDIMLLLKHMRL